MSADIRGATLSFRALCLLLTMIFAWILPNGSAHAMDILCWYEYPDGSTAPIFGDEQPHELPTVTAMVGREVCFDLSSLRGSGSDITTLDTVTVVGTRDTEVSQEVVEKEETISCDNAVPAATAYPVLIASGTKILPEADFYAGPSGYGIGVGRFYSKSSNKVGAFGRKWTSNIDHTLSFKYGLSHFCHGSEPPRESRRLVGVSHAAMASSRVC